MEKKQNKMIPSKSLKKDLLKLTQLNGVAAHEESIVTYIKNVFKNDKNIEIERDGLGSIAVIKKGKPGHPTISFTSHMDEVGFLLTKIDKNGYLYFSPVGGWWEHVLLAQLVTITTNSNKEFIGVIGTKPPHIITALERNKVIKLENMYIDIGASSDKEVKALGINIGDMITPTNYEAIETTNDRVIAKAHDNRASVAIGLEVMRRILNVKTDNTVIFVGSVQEEVGLRGARTSAYKWTPDVAFALDLTIANDIPGIPANDTKLGSGVALSMFDRTIIANKKLFRHVEKIASKNKIPYTYDGLIAGGTDAGMIHLTKEGVLTMTLSTPSRYMHSHNSVVDLKDLEATTQLVTEFIKDFTKKDLSDIEFK